MAMRLISVMDGLQFVFSTTELWHQMPWGRPPQRKSVTGWAICGMAKRS
jgi:hypothetical protein